MQFKIAGDRKAHHAPSGERYAIRYIMQYDKSGHKHLIENGKTDLQEIIQKDLESTKIQNIIARCVNPEELHMSQKHLIDITQMPQTMMEANNLMIEAKSTFDRLPADVKRMYNMSAEQYIADMAGKQEIWQKVMEQHTVHIDNDNKEEDAK